MKKWDEWLLIRGLLSVLNDKEVPQVIGRKQWLQTSGVWRKKALISHRLNAKCGDKAGNSRYQRSTRRLKTNKQTKKWEIVSDWATRIRAKLLLELLLSLLESPIPNIAESLIPWDPVHLSYGVTGVVVGIEKKDLLFAMEIAAPNFPLAKTMHNWER